MKSLISLSIFSLVSLSSCEKALDRSYKRATDEAGEEKEKQAEAEYATKARELVKETLGLRDLNAVASTAGVDYPALLERALRKEKDAVAKLLWMAGNAKLDTASAEGYSWSMVKAARLIGDKQISEAVMPLDDASREALRSAFLFEYGIDSDPETTVADIKRDFPVLWALIGISDNE
jgi:post-segregation antitoxin (ccd killing protein)